MINKALNLTQDFMRFSKSNSRRFKRDFFLIAYLIHKEEELRQKHKLRKTRLTKIVANFIEDLQSQSLMTGSYIPCVSNKPRRFGMVPFSESITVKPLPIYEWTNLAKYNQVWDIIIERSKEVVKLLSRSDILREKLLIQKDNPNSLDFEAIQIGMIDRIAEIYSKLNTEELNILASHRSPNHSNACLEYEFRAWETSFQELILNWNYLSLEDKVTLIKKLIIFCGQIEKKVEYSLYSIFKVINKIKKTINVTSSFEKDFLNTYLSRLEKNSVIENKSKIDFELQYVNNRRFLYPLTENLITFLEKSEPTSFSPFKEYQVFKKNLTRESIIKSEILIETVNLVENIEDFKKNMQDLHKKALENGMGNLLRPFRNVRFQIQEHKLVRSGRYGVKI